MRHKVVLEAVPGLDVTFDNAALPWHTSATVTGQDRPGVLAALAAAFAAAGVVVHRARVTTAGSDVVDRFALSDRHGRKLDAAAIERVRRALAGERPPPPAGPRSSADATLGERERNAVETRRSRSGNEVVLICAPEAPGRVSPGP